MDHEAYIQKWYRSMQNARAAGLKATRISQHLYAVRSRSKQVCDQHLVSLDAQGRIASCSDCKGAEIFLAALAEDKLRTPCAHMGAVARRLLRERGAGLPQAPAA